MNKSELIDDNKQCSICATDLVFYIRRTDKYAYHSCPNCSLITSVPKPTNNEISDFYNGFLFGMPTEEYFRARIADKTKDVALINRDIKKYFATDSLSLLDLGGGTGFFSACFHKLGYKTTLIDIDDKACDYARLRFPEIKVINADPINYTSDEKYDVVFANQVIEHYRDIRGFMNSIKNFIKPNGVLIIATPNQQCKEYFFRTSWWMSYIYKTTEKKSPFNFSVLKAMLKFIIKPWICCDPPRHIFSFNKKSISKLAAETNWSVLKVFTEYSPRGYYSGRPNNVIFRRGYLKHPLVLARYLYAATGILLVRLIDFKNNYGGNLVIHLRQENL